jgi:hypothetical protein
MMASPTQGMKAQPQAGLAALAQPAQAPRGMPAGNMQQIMARAKQMSDAQLAEVLSGKSMDVPQYVAMTEAMGRKSLRTAVQGQQAMQQAKQPSIKDKFLAEDAKEQMAQMMAQAPQMGGQGISALPAPNMDSMGMAGGGIIAFEEGGNIQEDPLAYLSGLDSASLAADQERVSQLKAQRKATQEKERFEFLKQSAPEVAAAMAKKDPSLVKPAAVSPALPPMNTDVKPDPLGRYKAGSENAVPLAPKAPVTGVGTAPGNQPFSVPSFEQMQGKRSQDYLSNLLDLTKKQRAGLDQIKKEGGGEALMQLASGILSRPTLAQGIGAALPMVASTSAATRKEIQGQNAMANDYDLNIAKAREAAEKGDMALALQYQQVANQAKAQTDQAAYQQGMLGVYGQRNAMMKDQYDSAKIPGQLGKIYADATKAIKDQYNGIVPPSKQKQYNAAIDAEYRKRAGAIGLGKYLDMYSPGAPNTNFNIVESLPKGAKIVDPFAEG